MKILQAVRHMLTFKLVMALTCDANRTCHCHKTNCQGLWKAEHLVGFYKKYQTLDVKWHNVAMAMMHI